MSSRRYRFQGFELDALARELRSGDDAVAPPLKSFECLIYLLEHRERAVGREIHRKRKSRRSGPTAENILRQLAIASGLPAAE